jgi:broad specificity phosphatase PhoE
MIKRLFIVRHGNTFGPGDVVCRIGARTDIPLVASGRTQAERIGAALARYGARPVHVSASPLKRAWETAEIIARAFGEHCRIMPEEDILSEIDYGPDEGVPESQVVARVGQCALEQWSRMGPPPDGWLVDAERRIAAWHRFIETFRKGDAQDAVCVTSNGAARYALLARPDLAQQAQKLGTVSLGTGCCGLIRIGTAGACDLAFWNRAPPELDRV